MLDTWPPEPRVPSSARRRLLYAALHIWYQRDRVVRELLKFGAVGGVGFVADIGLFNLLLFAGGEGPLHDQPLVAKTLSVTLATIITYVGHRAWTFRHRTRIKHSRGYPLFFLFNGLGLGIALACLWFSRYVLDLSGPIADNVSANVVGLALGTLFRYWSYRTWVFPANPSGPVPPPPAAREAEPVSA